MNPFRPHLHHTATISTLVGSSTADIPLCQLCHCLPGVNNYSNSRCTSSPGVIFAHVESYLFVAVAVKHSFRMAPLQPARLRGPSLVWKDHVHKGRGDAAAKREACMARARALPLTVVHDIALSYTTSVCRRPQRGHRERLSCRPAFPGRMAQSGASHYQSKWISTPDFPAGIRSHDLSLASSQH